MFSFWWWVDILLNFLPGSETKFQLQNFTIITFLESTEHHILSTSKHVKCCYVRPPLWTFSNPPSSLLLLFLLWFINSRLTWIDNEHHRSFETMSLLEKNVEKNCSVMTCWGHFYEDRGWLDLHWIQSFCGILEDHPVHLQIMDQFSEHSGLVTHTFNSVFSP